MLRRLLFLLLLGMALLLAARVSTQHGLQVDLSDRARNTLPESARLALEALDGPLSVTAYIPELPLQRRQTSLLVERMQRVHPDTQLQFIDPAYHPEQVRAMGIRGNGELIIEANGRKEHLAGADADLLAAALVRLARDGDEWILVIDDGRLVANKGPAGLSALAGLLEHQGYHVVTFTAAELARIPDNTAVVLLPSQARNLTTRTTQLLLNHLDQGGAMFWLHEGADLPELAGRFGIQRLPGTVVDAAAARLGMPGPAHAVISRFDQDLLPLAPRQDAVLAGARALSDDTSTDWSVQARLTTGAQSWNETGALRGEISRNASAGEQAGPLPVILAMQNRQHPSSRTVISGDGDFLSNAWLHRAGNHALALGLTHWLTDNQALPTDGKPAALAPDWSKSQFALLAGSFMFGLPLLYVAIGLLIRRQRRRSGT